MWNKIKENSRENGYIGKSSEMIGRFDRWAKSNHVVSFVSAQFYIGEIIRTGVETHRNGLYDNPFKFSRPPFPLSDHSVLYKTKDKNVIYLAQPYAAALGSREYEALEKWCALNGLSYRRFDISWWNDDCFTLVAYDPQKVTVDTNMNLHAIE